jgi:alanyl-tRNA synthetase
MKASELRSRYLEFFAERDHKVLPGSPLVPNDPTLLLTSAGMVQFKDVFWGRAEASFPRAATCQKCFRTTDIENVGRTAYHNTFFEMLGNFSFGDYFKEGAIRLAWEFLVDELGVPAERLSASVYQDDDEAFAIWRDVVGLPEERIVRLGKEHNWWGPVGDSGPCGPDSEIFYDTGVENACGPDCAGVACECNRYSEMWNLVFMEYEVGDDGSPTLLDRKNIDTGMGLERTSAVLQGVPTVFETDLFRPIVEVVEAACPRALTEADRVHRNSIADHVRGVLFLLADGVMPGNERQGYVLRRILRRAVRAGEKIELPSGSLSGFVDPVIDVLGGVYPEIAEARDLVHRLIAREEETFRRTLRDGERRLTKILDELHEAGKTVLPGELLFELYDTYGFPPEMTEEIAAERGMAVDWPGFKRALNEQQTRSKRASADISSRAGVSATPTVSHKWHRTPTEFLGYEQLEADAEVLGFDQDDSHVVFSATPFYAESGGQVGDTGIVRNLSRGFEARIVDTTRHEEGATLHHLGSADVVFEKGDRCRLTVDADRRRRIERNHTATHLLHAALREVLGPHAKQAGSLVDDAELRFDFSHFEKLSPEEIARVENLANASVLQDLKVEPTEMSLEEANAAGAIGLFEEEYRGKEKVRVLSICDEDTGECISMELCGGTHVARSGEIGLIKVVSEESIASGVRRIRAITGDAVLRRLRDDEMSLARLREAVGDDPLAGVERLRAQLKETAARVEAASAAEAHEHVDLLLEGAEPIGDVRWVSGRVDLSAEQLKELADALEEKARPAVVLLVGDAGGSGIAVCKRSKDVKAIDAGELIAAVSGALGGGGGGGKRFAQGGGPQIDRLDEALEAGAKIVREALE